MVCGIAAAMEEEKKLKQSEKYRFERCLVALAVCLSTISILLTIACGVTVLSMKEKHLEHEARLKRCESRHVSGNTQFLEDLHKSGIVKNPLHFSLFAFPAIPCSVERWFLMSML